MRWVPAAVIVVLGVSAAGAYFEVPSRFFDRARKQQAQMITHSIANDTDVEATDANASDDIAVALDSGDGGQNSIAINLPGGFGIKLPMDEPLNNAKDFKVDNVGPYPGAFLRGIRVRMLDESSTEASSQVEFRFTAPASPEAVVDWYAAEFEKRGTRFERRGARINGRTTEGKSFELTAEATPRGSTGLFRVRENG